MAYKKSCGNTIKFATQNISPALIQVRFTLYTVCNLFQKSIFLISGCHSSSIWLWLHYINGSKFQQRRCTTFQCSDFLHTTHAWTSGNLNINTFVCFHPTTKIIHLRSSLFILLGFVSEELQSILSGMTKTILMSNNLCNHTSRYSTAINVNSYLNLK